MVDALFLTVVFLVACLAVNMCMGLPEEPERPRKRKPTTKKKPAPKRGKK